MAEGSDVDDIRVFRMNDDPSNMVGFLESHVFPGLTSIFGFVNTITPVRASGIISLACPNPNHIRSRRSHSDISDRYHALVIKNWGEGCAVVRCFPETARGSGHVECERLRRRNSNVDHTPALS